MIYLNLFSFPKKQKVEEKGVEGGERSEEEEKEEEKKKKKEEEKIEFGERREDPALPQRSL